MEQIFNFEFPIPYAEASQAAQDVVNLIYANQEYCQITKVWNDLKTFCPNGDCLTDEVIIKNAKKNTI